MAWSSLNFPHPLLPLSFSFCLIYKVCDAQALLQVHNGVGMKASCRAMPVIYLGGGIEGEAFPTWLLHLFDLSLFEPLNCDITFLPAFMERVGWDYGCMFIPLTKALPDGIWSRRSMWIRQTACCPSYGFRHPHPLSYRCSLLINIVQAVPSLKSWSLSQICMQIGTCTYKQVA